MSFLSSLHFSIFYALLVRKSKKVSFAVVVALKTIPFRKHLLLIDVIQTSGIQGAHRAISPRHTYLTLLSYRVCKRAFFQKKGKLRYTFLLYCHGYSFLSHIKQLYYLNICFWWTCTLYNCTLHSFPKRYQQKISLATSQPCPHHVQVSFPAFQNSHLRFSTFSTLTYSCMALLAYKKTEKVRWIFSKV